MPLFPQFGLEPNVYYIPPIHAPTAFLRQMFGPGAAAAVKTYRAAADDPDLAGLLGLFGCTERVVPPMEAPGRLDHRHGRPRTTRSSACRCASRSYIREAFE